MRLRRFFIPSLTVLVFLAGCDDSSSTSTTTSSSSGSTGGSGGSAGAGGDGGGGAGGGASTIEKPANVIPGQYVFFLNPKLVTPDQVKNVAAELLAPQEGTLLNLYDSSIVGFSANGLDDTKALAIGKDSRISSIGQDCVVKIADSQSSAPWNLDRIDTKALALDTKYDYAVNGEGVHVYVVDTGIRATHSEFSGRVSGGVDFVNDGNGTNDCNGHGTHVAGIIGGTISGVAKGVSLHPVRVGDCQGNSAASMLIAAAGWIEKNRQIPAIANVSMAGPQFSQLNFAYAQLWNNDGMITVAAAGNDGKPTNQYSPAQDSAVISVGATDKTDTRWKDSNTNPTIFAPGVGIVSADFKDDTAMVTKDGTSMAAAHVSGVIALDLEFRRNKLPSKIVSSLTTNASAGVVQNPGGTKKDLVYSRYTDPQMGFAPVMHTFLDANGNPILGDASGALAKDAYWASLSYVYAPFSGAELPCSLGIDAGNKFGLAACYGDPNSFSFSPAWLDIDNIWQTARHIDIDADQNHDADFCIRSPQGIQCGKAVGAGLFQLQQWDTNFSDVAGWTNNSTYWSTIRFADINGDGKADVCGRSGGGINCATSDGNSFVGYKNWTTSFDDSSNWGTDPSYYGTIQFIDLDGDGQADVCGRGGSGLLCGLSTGTSFQVSQWDDYFTDGGPWKGAAYWGTIQFADIDGDGKMDVCGRAENGIVCRRSTGTTFGPVELWETSFADTSGWAASQDLWGTIRFPDINGDGRADVCGRASTGVYCAVSTGSKFAYGMIWSNTFTDVAGWPAKPSYWGTIRFPDVNGDGIKDICARDGNGLECGLARVP